MIVVAEVGENAEWRGRVEGPTDPGALRTDGGGRRDLVVGGAIIPVARSVLGADYDLGDRAVLARCGAHRFVAAFRGNRARFFGVRDYGELPRAPRICIGRWRIDFRPALRGDEIRS